MKQRNWSLDKQPKFTHQNESDFLQRSRVPRRLGADSKHFVNSPFGSSLAPLAHSCSRPQSEHALSFFRVDLIFGNSQKIFEAEPAK